jgi:exo-1,4-beta-D-glucosaminidase
VPPVEELKKLFPPDKLWPMNEFWDYHAGGGEFKNIDLFANALQKRYGDAKNVTDFAWKSQAMTYEGERAMFEAYGRNKYKSTGIIQWMMNNAWPSLIWHLYDYNLVPAGGYFGTKKALEMVHIQFSYDDRTVTVVNGEQEPQNGLKAVAKIYDTSMKERFSHDAQIDVPADGVARSFAVPEPADISTTYFLDLRLFSSAGTLISQNFYWLSTKPDVLDFAKSEWYYTPMSAFADFSDLEKLPKEKIKASLHTQTGADEMTAHVSVENPGKHLAFLVRLRLLRGKDGPEIVPVFWGDNYFSLLPGEKRTIDVKIRNSDLNGVTPILAVDGFNVHE